jgi:hypothetical protein
MNSDRVAKLLFTAMSVVLMVLGLAAILMESHTGVDKRGHVVTLQGGQAVWMGQTLMLLGVMPLAAWVPKRYLVWFLSGWGFGFLSWVFVGLYGG